MTPQQKIKYLVLVRDRELYLDRYPFAGPIDADNLDKLWSDLEDSGDQYDAMGEVRGGDVETGLKAPYSRHYESKSVAAQYIDGSWVGWTYWYGGGKHGEPDAIDWIDDAYDLNCTEEEKVVTVRTFSVVEPVQ